MDCFADCEEVGSCGHYLSDLALQVRDTCLDVVTTDQLAPVGRRIARCCGRLVLTITVPGRIIAGIRNGINYGSDTWYATHLVCNGYK